MSLFGTQKLFGGTQSSPFGSTPSTSTAQPGFGFSTGSAAPTSLGTFTFGTSSAAGTSGLFQPAVQKTTASTNLFGLGTGTSPFSTFGANVSKPATSLFSFSAPSTQQATGFFGPQSSLGSTLKPIQPVTGSLFQTPGDERDAIIARWNQLQAMWGTGTGYSAHGIATYTPDNTFARFKAVVYNALPTSTDADGLVCIYLARSFSEVLPQRQALQDTLFRLLGGRPNLQLTVEEIRPCVDQENHTEVILKVIERQPAGHITNIGASDLERYLSSPTVAPQLQSQLCAYKLTSEVRPSPAQLAAYKENPPAGIDRLIWHQACIDNPFPDRTIPVPLIGFTDLRRRKLDQIAFSRQQSSVLKQIGDLVEELKTGQLTLHQKIAQLKRKQIEISHRVLKVLRRQEVHRRAGFAISADEETLRCGLERIWTELTSPRGLRVRFQEVSASVKTNSENTGNSDKENFASGDRAAALSSCGIDEQLNWNLDADSWAELKEYLFQRQSGIRELQHLLTEMSATVKIMEENPALTKPPGSALPLLLRSTPNKVSFALNTRAR
ncbi:hypothetical protein X801_04494 [Opisthorchis viverrini]|uniref:Nucleoporin Nup54 alpha-helical domain-containing protein n=1 Tax=Opisthorchis viverrini TaxID=6198 RepID=A0A1S8WYY2_OPIVI|nr:hypothetical protein X801_04494 [Opisthorchis viverrini]